jgi:hypothetical protein
MCTPEHVPDLPPTRLIMPQPITMMGTGERDREPELLAQLEPGVVFMMGDNPALAKMPERPTLADFFEYRFSGITKRHLISSAMRALNDGQKDNVVIACLLHDIANACLIRSDHGYWGAQMIRPYVDEEVAWAVEKHQSLRYFADPEAGYAYPESYVRFFGPDYVPPDYIRREAEAARAHPWYMTSRLVTKYDLYFFNDVETPSLDPLRDVIARTFRQPDEGLGFDGSTSAHMWRTMIWPNNLL